MENKKRTISIIGIFLLVLTVIGGTLAYWTWTTNTTEQTNVVFTVTSDFSCAADGGGNITSNDVSLVPTTCTDTSRAIKRKVTVTPTLNRETMTLSMDLWLTINDLGEGLKKSNNFKYVLTTSSTSCEEGTIIASGNFKGRKVGNKVNLLTNELYVPTSIVPEVYWLYIWLDAEETSSSTMNQTFSLSLGGQCEEVETLVGEAYALLLESDIEHEEIDTPYELIFVRSETPITADSEYDGKVVAEVYSGIETTTTVPWESYASDITIVEFKDTIRPISTAWWFHQVSTWSEMTKVDLSKLDTSQVTDMSGMFYATYVKDAESIANFDVSNVRDMSSTFSYYRTDGLDLSNWNVSNVTDMQSLFNCAYGLTSAGDVSNWDTSQVTDMNNMFQDRSVNITGISKWNVSNVTDMSQMFLYSSISATDDLSLWDTSSVTNMSLMFNWASISGQMDLSGWDVRNVKNHDGFADGVGENLISPIFSAN